ncbi:hypothetical protein [Brevibacillus dissolubilis]|uniref:hypothetical protein n=1 Tax=Brevibacillus dissolubilis TaxID=1844116 RepID=UPI001117284A|nr:hypothetical protein [Brevibacillus dissolubilis]
MIYCRYREISPVCMGRHRPLKQEEVTIEHLIPKTKMRQASFRDRYGLKGIGTSSPENTDYACSRCNHLKKNATDLEFAWKLRYFSTYQLDLRSREKLRNSLRGEDQILGRLSYKQVKQIVHTLMYGECTIEGEEALLRLGHTHVLLRAGTVVWLQMGKSHIKKNNNRKAVDTHDR